MLAERTWKSPCVEDVRLVLGPSAETRPETEYGSLWLILRRSDTPFGILGLPIRETNSVWHGKFRSPELLHA